MCYWQSIWQSFINPPAWLQTVEVLLAMVGLWHLISWPIRSVWHNRERWLAEFIHGSNTIRSLALQNTVNKDCRLSWTSPEPQATDDRYRINFGKKRGRVISGLEFYERSPSNEFPSAWRLFIVNEWLSPIMRHIDGRGRIIATFSPIKAHGIEVVIREPRLRDDDLPYHWRIENVYFREAKLFARWLRWKI